MARVWSSSTIINTREYYLRPTISVQVALCCVCEPYDPSPSNQKLWCVSNLLFSLVFPTKTTHFLLYVRICSCLYVWHIYRLAHSTAQSLHPFSFGKLILARRSLLNLVVNRLSQLATVLKQKKLGSQFQQPWTGLIRNTSSVVGSWTHGFAVCSSTIVTLWINSMGTQHHYRC